MYKLDIFNQIIQHLNFNGSFINFIMLFRFNTEESSDGAIMFTKSKRPVDNRQRLNLSARSRSQERLDMSARRESGEDYDEILGNILYKENRVPPIRVSAVYYRVLTLLFEQIFTDSIDVVAI